MSHLMIVVEAVMVIVAPLVTVFVLGVVCASGGFISKALR